MPKKPALGQGLNSIFADTSAFSENLPDANSVVQLKLSQVEPNADQPRKTFDRESLSALADSIASNGVIQPILVRSSDSGYYVIIAGERRWRAAKQVGLDTIPAIIMEADDLKAAKMALIENVQRENLNPYDEAEGYRALIDDYNVTHEELSTALGKSRSAITNSLRLLELPDETLDMLRSGALTAGHGRALLGLKDKAQIIPLATKIAKRNLSVREVEAAVRTANKLFDRVRELEEMPETSDEKPEIDYIGDLENRIRAKCGHPVRIIRSGSKKRIEIDFAGNDEFESIVKLLCGDTFFND